MGERGVRVKLRPPVKRRPRAHQRRAQKFLVTSATRLLVHYAGSSMVFFAPTNATKVVRLRRFAHYLISVFASHGSTQNGLDPLKTGLIHSKQVIIIVSKFLFFDYNSLLSKKKENLFIAGLLNLFFLMWN